MGRRKIEIKAIKDDRNRSVTFLKRKGGLFKKAHELSVLCSVDVAVFVFGNNKKLHEYSSTNMNDLITRYQFHPGPSEHKGPSDFSGGNDDDDDEEGDGTPPISENVEASHMMGPPQFHGQTAPQPSFARIRHNTPTASPPIPNGPFPNGAFTPHPGQRAPTPQPGGSRPNSRNGVRRMAGPVLSAQKSHQGITYMPTPPIYNPTHGQTPGMMPQQAPQYPYQSPPQQHQPPPPPPQQQQQPPAPTPYMEDRRPSAPPGYAHPHPPPPQRTSPPQPAHTQVSHQQIPQISVMPQPEQQRDPLPPPPVEPKTEPQEHRPQPPLLNTDSAIKKLPQRKTHSIFTPIEESRSVLAQHLASFANDPQSAKQENRPHSVDVGSVPRSSPPKRTSSQNSQDKSRTGSMASIPESASVFTPPSRANSLNTGSVGGNVRSRGPRLTVQIPDEGAESGSNTAGESNSPRNPETSNQVTERSGRVLPPPSPSATALLSAGATGPPNPFARPLPQQGVNGEQTPASALPSRFLGTEFLPSPNSFDNYWNFRGEGSNTMHSPLNFATPVAGSGPSFLREDHTALTTSGPSYVTPATAGLAKRKSPDFTEGADEEAKRVRVE